MPVNLENIGTMSDTPNVSNDFLDEVSAPPDPRFAEIAAEIAAARRAQAVRLMALVLCHG
jgi:hypothetical protein